MPRIVAKKDGTCRTCGGRVRKGEYADFQADKGLAHPEPACAQGAARHRPNIRAGTCTCGTHVPPGKGHLRLVEDKGPGLGKRWAVDCARCAGL
ncbi:MAG TPA: hypothetical protein VFZ09_27620 [Archangium sp.]|uniref:hypothetical protein n=1 Tax=Archangium sp. TaxID=1872627 RepID=UPI002E31CF98|nr:hypothetical protein [Archangium sp.]HEX5750030.1 hypothetical protein [Archangium sp.]